MLPGVSVVICCHNSAKRLPETLRYLAAQRAENIPWEVLVIDNASTDDTSKVAQNCWPATASAPLRIVLESKRGTGNARFRSFTEARHEYSCFLDDDNWVDQDWISKIVNFFQTHPEAAAVGGPSRPVFETEPPPWFLPFSGFYAVGDQHSFFGDITDEHGTLLWTAGMSIRTERLRQLVAEGFHFITCVGEDLPVYRGEDTEICLALRRIGGRLFYDPRMAIKHYMPADRMTWPNALKQVRMIGGSSPVIDLYLLALQAPRFAERPNWKKTRLFYSIKARRELASLMISHPIACLRLPEGSLTALKYETLRARLATLGNLRGRFETLRKQIANSPWARPLGKQSE
jgi:glycosyltransferase involved in cell wall biosynthesis